MNHENHFTYCDNIIVNNNHYLQPVSEMKFLTKKLNSLDNYTRQCDLQMRTGTYL